MKRRNICENYVYESIPWKIAHNWRIEAICHCSNAVNDDHTINEHKMDYTKKHHGVVKVKSSRYLFYSNSGIVWILFISFFLVLFQQMEFTNADYYTEYSKTVLKNMKRIACDGYYLKIDCPDMTSISIQSALYGRRETYKKLCSRKQRFKSPFGLPIQPLEKNPDTNCEAATSLEKTVNECHDHRLCRLFVHDRTFGEDPCPGTYKYLTVEYKCAPNDFKQIELCSNDDEEVKFRCRHDTVISIYDITINQQSQYTSNNETNIKDISAMKKDILVNFSTACHGRNKCTFKTIANCSKEIKMRYSCIPSQYLTEKHPYEIPQYEASTTTQPLTIYTTVNTTNTEQHTATQPYQINYETSPTESTFIEPNTSTTIEAYNTTSLPSSTQVLITSESVTANIYWANSTNEGTPTTVSQEQSTASIVTNSSVTIATDVVITTPHYQDNSTEISLRDKINSARVVNEFARKGLQHSSTEQSFTRMEITTINIPCDNCTITTTLVGYGIMNQLLSLLVYIKENQDKIIIAALSGVCVALFLTIVAILIPFPRKKKKQRVIVHRHSSECSRESVNQYRLSQYRTSEDEHENMSLLSAQLQSHTPQNHVDAPSANHAEALTSEHENDGRASVLNQVLAKVCCTCCCYNAPWQRTGTLKRRMRDRKRDIYKVRQRYSSSMSEENFNGRYQQRSENFVEETDGISSQAVLDNVDGRHIPIVTEQHSATHYDRRTPSFSSHTSHVIHSVDNSQPSPMATSPRSARHESAYKTNTTGRESAYKNKGVPIPHDLQNMQLSTNNVHSSNHHQTSMDRRSRNNISTFKKNSPVNVNQSTSSQSTNYYPHTNGNEIYPQYTTIPSNYNHIPDSRYRRHNTNTLPNDNVFVQSAPQRHLAATARTVDLNRKDSSGRPPWMEVRRASIYDNSLPRNIEEYNFYQVPELPGGRNLNYYY